MRVRRERMRAGPDVAVESETADAIGLVDDTSITCGDQAELRARFRARADQAEAQRELHRLRSRYWSGERIVEEAKSEALWWEHPEADPYAVLDLLPGASIEQAATARRQIARRSHPDLPHFTDKTRDVALRRMIAANAAYERLRRALRPVFSDADS